MGSGRTLEINREILKGTHGKKPAWANGEEKFGRAETRGGKRATFLHKKPSGSAKRTAWNKPHGRENFQLAHNSRLSVPGLQRELSGQEVDFN